MAEFLTCGTNGFMFGWFGFILAHLGHLWVGIADWGAHVGLWVSVGLCGCHHGVLMVSPSCLGTAFAVCLRFCGVVDCGFCLGSAGRIGMSVMIWWRLGGVSVMSWWPLGGYVCASCCVCELFY
jgi:hypothetical protein